ncbi:MAG: hypothetical protein RL605_569 [Actinomycetota bacterium]|jgi:hypothetical protein
MKMNRALLSVGGFAYAMFHAVLGMFWAAEYDDTSWAFLAVGLYAALAISTILLYRGILLPMPQAIATAVLAQLIPVFAQSHLQTNHYSDYSTWYVLGIGTLMSTVALRGHIWIAVSGMTVTTIEVMAWAGWQNFFATGLLGPIMLLLGTCVVTVGLSRAATETALYAEQNAQAVAHTAAQKTAGEQRSMMLSETLSRTRPLLALIAEGKALTTAQRREARLTEAALRDEIRGRDLMSAVTREAIYAARERGVVVNVLDEGGLAQLGADQVARLHEQIAEALGSLQQGKVTIRAPKGEAWAVTVAAFDDSASTPTLWLKLVA